MPSEETVEEVTIFIVTFAIDIITLGWKAAPQFLGWLAVALDIFEFDILSGGDYASSMLYEGHPITCHYLEFKLWCGFFPYCHESGYCTDLYNGNPVGGWWYIPTSESIWFFPPLIPCHPLSIPWQLRVSQSHPRVTRLGSRHRRYIIYFCLFECLDRWRLGRRTTGTTFPLPSGTYYVQVSDYNGVFHYFDVGGTPVYDNPANITVSEENFTITAHYYYDPFHLVTVYAYNQYSCPGNLLPVYVDSQLAGYTDSNGAFPVLLPEGNHMVGVAWYVNDYGDNYCHFDYPQWTSHTLQHYDFEGYYISGGDVYTWVDSDITVQAWYWSA